MGPQYTFSYFFVGDVGDDPFDKKVRKSTMRNFIKRAV